MFRNPMANQARTEPANNPAPQPSWPNKSAPDEALDYAQSPVQTPTTTRAMTESESLAREIKEGTLNGFIGNGTAVVGEAMFKGMLRVDGHLSGRVTSEDGTLIVGNNGQVDANVEVAVATINGTINGDIIATKRIEIGRAAKVTGNIQTAALVIEQGAIFEGSCRMLHLKKAADKPSADKPAKDGEAAKPSTAKPPTPKPLTAVSSTTVETPESAQPSIVSDVAS